MSNYFIEETTTRTRNALKNSGFKESKTHSKVLFEIIDIKPNSASNLNDGYITAKMRTLNPQSNGKLCRVKINDEVFKKYINSESASKHSSTAKFFGYSIDGLMKKYFLEKKVDDYDMSEENGNLANLFLAQQVKWVSNIKQDGGETISLYECRYISNWLDSSPAKTKENVLITAIGGKNKKKDNENRIYNYGLMYRKEGDNVFRTNLLSDKKAVTAYKKHLDLVSDMNDESQLATGFYFEILAKSKSGDKFVIKAGDKTKEYAYKSLFKSEVFAYKRDEENNYQRLTSEDFDKQAKQFKSWAEQEYADSEYDLTLVFGVWNEIYPASNNKVNTISENDNFSPQAVMMNTYVACDTKEDGRIMKGFVWGGVGIVGISPNVYTRSKTNYKHFVNDVIITYVTNVSTQIHAPVQEGLESDDDTQVMYEGEMYRVRDEERMKAKENEKAHQDADMPIQEDGQDIDTSSETKVDAEKVQSEHVEIVDNDIPW